MEHDRRRSTLLDVARASVRKAREHRAALSGLLDDVLALARLVTAWGRRDYTAVPWGTIVLAAGALVYFVNPFDAVPDQIPGLGYVDDASVIAVVVNSIRTDIERFVRWEGTLRAQQAAYAAGVGSVG